MSRPCSMLITSRLVSSPNLSAISHTGTCVPMSLATCATQHIGVLEMLNGRMSSACECTTALISGRAS